MGFISQCDYHLTYSSFTFSCNSDWLFFFITLIFFPYCHYSSGYPMVPPPTWMTASWRDREKERSSDREQNSPSWRRGWPSCAGRWVHVIWNQCEVWNSQVAFHFRFWDLPRYSSSISNSISQEGREQCAVRLLVSLFPLVASYTITAAWKSHDYNVYCTVTRPHTEFNHRHIVCMSLQWNRVWWEDRSTDCKIETQKKETLMSAWCLCSWCLVRSLSLSTHGHL